MHIGIRITITVVCLLLSGTFSGLTLGMMSLGVMDLQVLQESGTEAEKRSATKILPLRKRGNFLLCTLLIGNTAVNSALSIVTADLFGGVPGFIASTVAILYFGEIIPQAVCYRFGLAIGAFAVPLVKFFMLLTSPLSYPTSKLLDCTLGLEPTTRYNKSQLRSLLSIHGNQEFEPDLEAGAPRKGSPVASRDTVREIIPHPPHESSDAPPSPVTLAASQHSEMPPEERRSMRAMFNFPRRLRERRRDRSSSNNSQTDPETDNNPSRRHRSDRKQQGDKQGLGLLTREEMAIFGGAFEFGNKMVSQVMTHLDKVFMLDASLSLNFNVMLIVFQSGHSRIPVYEGDRSNIIGALFAKDLILLDPEDSVPIRTILHFFNRPVLCVSEHTPLFEMLNIFKQGRGHLAIVQQLVTEPFRDPNYGTMGVATLEDLIEELIGEDIVDETDVYTDNVSRLPVKRVRSIDPEVLKMFDARHVEDCLTEKEVLVVSSYLAHNTHEFSDTCVRTKILRETLANAPIEEYFDESDERYAMKKNGTNGDLASQISPVPVSAPGISATHTSDLTSPKPIDETEPPAKNAQEAVQSLRRRIGHKVSTPKADGTSLGPLDGTAAASDDDNDDDIFIYKRGVPSINAYLILNGRLEIKAGADGFISEAGPWTLLGVHALVDDLYAPDFTARVLEKPARLLRLSRKFYRVLQQHSGENPLATLVGDGARVSPHTFERSQGAGAGGEVSSAGTAAGEREGTKEVRIMSGSTKTGRTISWGEIEPSQASKPDAENDIVKKDE